MAAPAFPDYRPTRRCNSTQGLSPFTVNPRFVAGATNRGTTEYCFTVSSIPTSGLVPIVTASDAESFISQSYDYDTEGMATRTQVGARHTVHTRCCGVKD
jgi:hypothetical protein